MDINKEIRQAIGTGKVILGTNKSLRALKLGRAKLVIVTSNCAPEILGDIKRYAGLTNVPVHVFNGDSTGLGLACGKPFLVSALTVLELGSSSILSLRGSR